MDYYLQLVQEYLLSLGGLDSNIPQPSTQSLTDMLRVLKFATEIHPHAQISDASVSVPFLIGHGCMDD
jgi:hypothetical protein